MLEEQTRPLVENTIDRADPINHHVAQVIGVGAGGAAFVLNNEAMRAPIAAKFEQYFPSKKASPPPVPAPKPAANPSAPASSVETPKGPSASEIKKAEELKIAELGNLVQDLKNRRKAEVNPVSPNILPA